MGFGSSLLVVSWGVPMFSAFWSFYFAVGFPALDVWRCVVGVRLLALGFWVCVSALVLALGFGHSDFGIGLLALGLWRWTFHVFPLLFSSFVFLRRHEKESYRKNHSNTMSTYNTCYTTLIQPILETKTPR